MVSHRHRPVEASTASSAQARALSTSGSIIEAPRRSVVEPLQAVGSTVFATAAAEAPCSSRCSLRWMAHTTHSAPASARHSSVTSDSRCASTAPLSEKETRFPAHSPPSLCAGYATLCAGRATRAAGTSSAAAATVPITRAAATRIRPPFPPPPPPPSGLRPPATTRPVGASARGARAHRG
eukprot:scaffold14006_cov68-Phaeocystis_antarctica.AAC.4